jgi:hypothetical protein
MVAAVLPFLGFAVMAATFRATHEATISSIR